MKPHNIVVDGYKASPDNLELGTYGSYGNETLKFCFKDGWDDTTSVIAVFNSNLDNPTSVLVESDGICKVPHEATDSVTNDGRITLVGYKDNAKIISLDLSFVVYNHSAVDGEPPQEPTPDIFQQILDVSKDAVDTANEAKEIASKSYEETKQYAEQAKQSADSAAQNAEIAKENADKVVSVKDEVDSAKQQALTEISDSKTTALKAIGDAETGAVNAVTELQTSAIAQIEASKQDALSGISTSKDSALDTIQSTQTTAVEQISSLSQTAKTEISDLKTQSLNEIQNKTAESVQSLTDAQENAIQAVEGAQSVGVKAVQDAQGDAETAISKAKTGALENITTEKETSVKAVNDAGSTATGAIADAKSDALSEIEAAKTGAVEAVTAEGDKQAERVQSIFPAVTADDDGKVPIVQNGAWTLGEVAQDAYTRAESDARYAPIESAIRPTVSGNPAVCDGSVAWNFQGLRIYGKSTQDGTPSLENPVPIVSSGDGGSVEIEISGANLLNPELFEPGFINETTGENQTCPTRTRTKGFIPITGNKLYVASVPATGDWTIYYFYDNNFSFLSKKSSSSIGSDIESFGIPKNSAFLRVSWFVSVDVISGTLAFASTANVPAQAFVEPQSLPLSTPTGLPGIPVDSDGNYTDAEGQQWVCDEIDCKNEAYIKNLTLIPDLSIGTFTKHVDGMFFCNVGAFSAPHGNSKILSRCTHFPSVVFQRSYGILVSSNYVIIGVALAETFDNVDDFNNFLLEQRENNTPVQLLYYQNESIEAPLSEDELAAYRALTTYPGTTVVSTAEPVAGIEARYVADGTKIIENLEKKISDAVTAAITLAGGNK